MIDFKIPCSFGSIEEFITPEDLETAQYAIPDPERPGEEMQALQLLVDVMDNPAAFRSGRRNDDAVNFCIGMHVLGYEPLDAFDIVCDKCVVASYNRQASIPHIERVKDYLSTWGPCGNRYRALEKAL